MQYHLFDNQYNIQGDKYFDQDGHQTTTNCPLRVSSLVEVKVDFVPKEVLLLDVVSKFTHLYISIIFKFAMKNCILKEFTKIVILNLE